MKTTILVNGKKISKKAATEQFGKERIENRIAEAIESYYEDPMQLITWMDGMEIKVSEYYDEKDQVWRNEYEDDLDYDKDDDYEY